LARIEGERVQLFTRNGHDWTAKMPRQAEALAGLGLDSAWLDGEVVVLGEEGAPDFQALQNAFEAGRSGSILYYLFDAPYLDGHDLRQVPVEDRRALLARLLERSDSELLRFSADFSEQPESILESACQMRLEGDDREFGKNRTLSFASSCNQFIVFSMDERKWRKLFDKQIGIL